MALHPLPAENPQRVRLKRFLQHREHVFFLAPEMFARCRQRLFQQGLSFRRIGRAMDAFELVVNFVMILIQAIQRSPVREGVIQGRIGQIRFCFGMIAQQTFHHGRQQLHFRCGFGAAQDPFDLIKHGAKNRVFHDESFCNGFHILIDGTRGRGVQIWLCDFFTTAAAGNRARKSRPAETSLAKMQEGGGDCLFQSTAAARLR